MLLSQQVSTARHGTYAQHESTIQIIPLLHAGQRLYTFGGTDGGHKFNEVYKGLHVPYMH